MSDRYRLSFFCRVMVALGPVWVIAVLGLAFFYFLGRLNHIAASLLP